MLILANKSDLPKAMDTAEASEALGLTGKELGRKWHVQRCCATSGDGLYEGLDWLVKTLKTG